MNVSKITAKSFGKKIAKTMKDISSSHVYFIIQQAYGTDLDWNDAVDILNKVLKEK
jgi:hypothetical protein